MVNERPEFRVQRTIPDPLNPTRSAYREGELIQAQVVYDWELQIGTDGDVVALRPASLERPSGNADRDAWANYRLAQGVPPDEVDAAGRNQLRDMEDPPPPDEQAAAELDAADEETAEGNTPGQEA